MQERLPINRQVVRIAIGMLVVAYGTNVSTPFLVLYKDRLGLSASQTMAIFVVYVVGILASLVLGGALSDRFGRRPVALPMMALSGIASIGMIFGRDEFIALLVSRLLLGAASGAVLGIGAAWLLELFGPGNEQRAALTTTLVSFAGFGGGAPVSALLYWLIPAPLVLPFLLHTVAVVGALVVVWPVNETHRAKPGHRIRPSFGVPVAARRAFLLVILPTVIWMFAFPSMGFALFPVLISDAVDGGEVAIAAAAGAITAWSGIGAKPIVGRLGGRAALPIGMWHPRIPGWHHCICNRSLAIGAGRCTIARCGIGRDHDVVPGDRRWNGDERAAWLADLDGVPARLSRDGHAAHRDVDWFGADDPDRTCDGHRRRGGRNGVRFFCRDAFRGTDRWQRQRLIEP